MPIIKSFSVGNGDMAYIRHGSDNFTIIDCNLNEENKEIIINEILDNKNDKNIVRFISTHPDEDHIGGLHYLDDEIKILNFYVVRNEATKPEVTESFKRYCELRDSDKAFFVEKGCSRKWMNVSDEQRGSSGINILWPAVNNESFKKALSQAKAGEEFNNISLVMRYSVEAGSKVMWLGDLETQFKKDIEANIQLEYTPVVFAAHHGRKSGKIPNTWLEKLQPDVVIIGEAK